MVSVEKILEQGYCDLDDDINLLDFIRDPKTYLLKIDEIVDELRKSIDVDGRYVLQLPFVICTSIIIEDLYNNYVYLDISDNEITLLPKKENGVDLVQLSSDTYNIRLFIIIKEE